MPTHRSAQSPARHITPSGAAHQFDKIVQELEMVRSSQRNRVVTGLLAAAPTSASTQGSGATATAWNINYSAGVVVVGGVALDVVAAADYSVHAATQYTGLTNGNSAIVALVAKNVSGTVTIVTVNGTAATTGSQVAPTDTEIQASVGAANSWVKIAELTINRTADTTVTQSQDNTKRPDLAVSVDTSFGDWSAVTA